MIKLKGVELPVNVIVIIVLCIIVLLSVTALFVFVWGSTGAITLESAKTNACQRLAMSNCEPDTSSIDVENFDANKDGVVGESGSAVDDTLTACKAGGGGDDNLYMLCKCWLGADEQTCKNSMCGCTGSAGTTSSNNLPPPPPQCMGPMDCVPPKTCVNNKCV